MRSPNPAAGIKMVSRQDEIPESSRQDEDKSGRGSVSHSIRYMDAGNQTNGSSLSDEIPESSRKDEDDSERGGISHSVQYLDAGDNEIATELWPGPFDLTAARKDVQTKEQQKIFSVVTVLDTSIPSDYSRTEHDIDDIFSAGILENPNVSVNVRARHISIHSKALIKAIGSVVLYYPSVLLGGEVIRMNDPCPLIGHNLQDLENYQRSYSESCDVCSQQPPATTHGGFPHRCTRIEAKHLGLLLDFVKDFVYREDIKKETARHAQNLCTFEMLWLLFKPGRTVYVQTDGKLLGYVVQVVSIDESHHFLAGTQQSYWIKLWNLQFDGRFVGRASKVVVIPQFSGERAVTSLGAFPCEFMDKADGGKTKSRVEQDGKEWYDLLCGKQIHYSGELAGPAKRLYEGRIYVDPASYYSQNPGAAPNICDLNDMGAGLSDCACEECYGRRPHPPANFPWSRYDLIDPMKEKDLTMESNKHGPKHRYLICDSTLYGFALKSRTWEQLHVSNCHAPKNNAGAIDTLVMPPERKEMIKALVQKFTGYRPTKSWGADFIESKGEGQIFLLHGSPGVGKTYTAECIAEYTNRPLLSLTCGDIGTNEVKLEEELSKWFRLAERWGAVMLLDEADAYLEARSSDNLQRNCLVSVFLRCVEYYRGILFLTTNRVGHFDDAFISRIHVIIKYDRLTPNDCKTIWKQFFNKLSDERKDFVITRSAKEYVLLDKTIIEMGWNGREIRNAFQTAVALAEYRFSQKENKSPDDGPTLDERDFEQVCNMTKQFKQYLTNLHGTDEEGRAFVTRTRAEHSGEN
ncbi:P-loop containing nucleoside triphosphate hydrolase protein [Chaetomium sp. MPI-SDFR-AT-0129]|nr:P-loop containing nucleoside triphosphate hydrolase protein [Chaetomium sp. MPI-SDFR-AT-0129]